MEDEDFPISPGRAQQLFDHAAIFPGFYFAFTTDSRAAGGERFCVNQIPRAAIFQEPACGFALKDVEVIHRYEFGGADGVRTHDLLDAIEARSQLRHGPTATNLTQRPSRFHRDALPAAPRPHRSYFRNSTIR